MRLAFPLAALAALAACAPPDHIEIEPKEVVLKRAKETANLRGMVKNRRGVHFADKIPQWKSSDPSVVSVGDLGVITAHKSGSAILTATYGDLTAEVPVEVVLVEEVRSEPAELVLPPEAEEPARIKVTVLGPGGKELRDRAVRFESMDEQVATVDARGGVWPHAVGETLIRAIVESREVTVKVKVERPRPAAKGK